MSAALTHVITPVERPRRRQGGSAEIPFGDITMGKLIYIANASLDGYCEDRNGGIDFGAPDEEYFGFVNDLERPVGIYLYGRRMYEAMTYWETAPIHDQPPWVVDFTNIWRGADIRVLEDAGIGIKLEDHPSAGVRRQDDSADEGRNGPRPHDWRS